MYGSDKWMNNICMPFHGIAIPQQEGNRESLYTSVPLIYTNNLWNENMHFGGIFQIKKQSIFETMITFKKFRISLVQVIWDEPTTNLHGIKFLC